jgi:hypothetical protein
MATPYDTNALIKQTTDMLAQTKAQGTTAFAGSTYDTNRAGAVQAITPASMTPQTPIAPVVTPETPLPIVSPYTLTAPEQQAQVEETGLTKSIADLTAQLDPSFRRQSQIDQEAKFGIQQKSDVYKGFQDKNTQLQAEQQGIQLQLQQTLENQKQAAVGQGVTAGGLAPHLRASQTVANQSLLTNAIQQFGNNANLAASQRDLSSAMAYADRAVEAEFLPKEKALATAQANLTNLRNSVELTSAQQKRADARQAQIDAQKAEIAEAKKMKQDTSDARIKAISNNTGNPALDNTAIAALNAAKSPEEVAAILQVTGLSAFAPEKVTQPASVQEYEYAKKNGYTGTFAQYQNEDANRKAVVAKAGVARNDAGLTPYQVFSATQSLSKDNQARTENAREISRQVSIMDTAYKSYTSGGDKNVATQAIIATFNKILDPTSVVRESEYDRTAAGQALLSRIQGKYENIAQGGAGVTAETLKSAVELGNQYLKNAQDSILAENKRSTEMARQFGLDSGLVATVATPQEIVPPADGLSDDDAYAEYQKLTGQTP